MAVRSDIVNGPSKFDLMVSLFEGNPTPRHRVIFEMRDGVDSRRTNFAKVAITGIVQEDGSGESWKFQGYIQKSHSSSPSRVEGFYSSAKREGYMFLPKPLSHIV